MSDQMTPKIEQVCPPINLAKGPYYDEESRMIYYVDLFDHALHSYNEKTNEHYSVDVDCGGQPITLIVKVKGEKNKFVIAVKNHLAIVNWDGVSANAVKPEHLVDVEGPQETTRLNGGKCDPANRLWAGTMGALLPGTHDQFEQEKGSLYVLKKGKKVEKLLSKIGISNALAWSIDKKKVYFIDSLSYKVDSYDYDDATAAISNGKTVFCFKKNKIEGLTDGLTIDQEGMLWITSFGGGVIVRVNPDTGALLQTLEIPSPQVTSVQFGGPNFDILYVTTSKVGFTKEQEKQYPLAGSMFKVTGLGVKGTPSIPAVF